MGAEPPVGTRRKKEKPDAEEDVEKKTRTVTQLQKELVDLKAALALAEAGQKKAKERRDSKKEKGRRRDDAEVEAPKRRKKEHLPFERGGLVGPGGGGDPGDDAPDWGGSGDSSGEEDTDLGTDESGEVKSPRVPGRKDEARKKKGDPPDDPGDDDDDPSRGSGKKGRKRKRKKKAKKKAKKEKRGSRERKLEKDKGPFGVAETRKVPKDDSSSGLLSESSSGSSQSFRKAPSGLTLHLRLQRYAMKHPGRLASRVLQRMAKATRFEGATGLSKRKELETPPCALTFFLTVLTPTLKDKWTPRTQRELRVLVEILDKMASAEGPTAADIVAQRIKALEQSVRDGNQWRKAKFLEIVDPEEVTLTDRGEANMMQKEVELEDRLKGKGQWHPQVTREKGEREIEIQKERAQKEAEKQRLQPKRWRRKRTSKRFNAAPGTRASTGEIPAVRG